MKQFLGESRKIEPQAPFCAVQLLTALNSYAEIFDGDDVKLLIAGPAERIRLQSIRDRLANGWDVPAEFGYGPDEDIL